MKDGGKADNVYAPQNPESHALSASVDLELAEVVKWNNGRKQSPR
jgi:hypothetical protein